MGPALASFAVLLPLCVPILLRTDDEIGQAVVAYALPYVVGAYSKSRCGFRSLAARFDVELLSLLLVVDLGEGPRVVCLSNDAAVAHVHLFTLTKAI